jgi:hypothetical protein
VSQGVASCVTFDFLTSTSLQSQGYLPPVCLPFMCAISPALNAPLTQPRFDLTHVLSWQSVPPPCVCSPRDLLSHKDGVSTFLPWSAFTQLSLGCTYWSQLAVIPHSLPSVILSMSFITFPQPVAAEHLHNFRLPCRCHEVFLLLVTAPFAPAIKVQTLTAVVGLPT